ncbi:hypothetical protein [Caballeronia telluris]|uniref:Uncharacterized protein n=1 Tax=Caballeronia telluris TaxID=326475 RepID=A0A158FZX8_9BURK|nr:hypothetical protein [Caballeronia telluris]SAL25396.1 hypothetical protein AWB66_01453 [Caballeronia telluris]
MNFDEFTVQLGALLREQPRATSAELTDDMTAFWNGHRVIYAFLCENGTGRLDEEFDPKEYIWAEWSPDLIRWLDKPRYGTRAEILEWIKEPESPEDIS